MSLRESPMRIVVNLDIMLARRKMRSKEQATVVIGGSARCVYPWSA